MIPNETISIDQYLALSALVFVIGMMTVVVRKNLLVALMGIELMLNATNIALVAFSKYNNNIDGQIMVFFIIAVAAAEVAVGLTLCISLYKQYKTLNVDDYRSLKG